MPSSLSTISPRKRKLCTTGVQTCDLLMPVIKEDRSCFPPGKRVCLHKEIQTRPMSNISTLNPLSVDCPDHHPAEPLCNVLEADLKPDKSYNPFIDPQILQAADGLELLSALAEKRPKSSSMDDAKRIYPSPSDSFKSDSASVAAIEDTLSPSEPELKSGQCTPRRDSRPRDLSPKWNLHKKDPDFLDFKTPSGKCNEAHIVYKKINPFGKIHVL